MSKKIKILNDYGWGYFTKGEVYELDGEGNVIGDNGYIVPFDNLKEYPEDWEWVDDKSSVDSKSSVVDESPKFKVGDKVRVVDNTFDEGLQMGEVADVVEYDGTKIPYRLKTNNGSFIWVGEDEIELVGNEASKKQYNPLDVQAGGGHYKSRTIQPVEYSNANNLSFNQGNVVKYITRYQDKNSIEDLEKVIHYTFIEAMKTYGLEGSTELKERIMKLLGENK